MSVQKDTYIVNTQDFIDNINENTAVIVTILGSTYTGHIDDIKKLNDMLVDLKYDIPIHVDAAIGGFIIPFSRPDIIWDFRLQQVKS